MTLELPTDLQSQVEELARQRGTNAQEIVIEATRAGIGATTGANSTGANSTGNNGKDGDTQARNATTAKKPTRELSPMEKAVAHIKANPIKSLGPVDAVADLEELRATRAQELSGPAKTETREQRRARIRAAIDKAQRHFAPLLHGGDAVSQLVAEKRADGERAAERGL